MTTTITRPAFQFFLFCLTWLALACTAQPSAQSSGAQAPEAGRSIQKIMERGSLRIGMTGDQPPYNFVDRSGALQGMDVDLARALAEAMGVEAEIVQQPFSELLPGVKSGKLDVAISGITMSTRRNTQVAFVGPYFATGKSILTKNAVLAQAQESTEINDANFRLLALAGSTSESFVKRVAPRAELLTIEHFDEGVDKIIAGEADALVADLSVCVLSVFRNPGAGLAALATPLSFEPIGIALPSDDAHFENLVSNYMRLLEETGILEQLRERWFNQSDWINQLPAKRLEPSPNALSL